MTRDELRQHTLRLLDQDFELPNVVLSDNLFDVHGFDSLDILDLLTRLEKLLGIAFTRREKDKALRLGTLTELLDHIEGIMYQRKLAAIAEETAAVLRAPHEEPAGELNAPRTQEHKNREAASSRLPGSSLRD